MGAVEGGESNSLAVLSRIGEEGREYKAQKKNGEDYDVYPDVRN